MNVAHPFMEGNGRSTHLDRSDTEKTPTLNAMVKSTSDSTSIKNLIEALTGEINSHEVFMKGIDYSYYYEET